MVCIIFSFPTYHIISIKAMNKVLNTRIKTQIKKSKVNSNHIIYWIPCKSQKNNRIYKYKLKSINYINKYNCARFSWPNYDIKIFPAQSFSK